MRATILVTAVALACSRAGGAPPQPAAAASASPRNLQQYIQDLGQTLNQASEQKDRTEAARRLLEIGTPQAREFVTNGLRAQDRRTQLACAEAVAGSVSPDPRWIPALADLLGRDRATTDAASRALARFDTNAAAYMALVQWVQRQPPSPFRTTAIPAMGEIVQKRVAEALIGIVNDPAEPNDVRTIAEGALAQLSGQTAIGQDPAGWALWWNARNANQPPEWRSQVIAEQHGHLESASERNVQELRQLMEQVRGILLDQYDRQPEADKPKVLLGCLNNPDATIRDIGAQIVAVAIGAGQTMTPEIHRRLIDLIGDANPQVRRSAIKAVAAEADPDALNAILVQLQIEKDSEVKVLLVQAVARTANANAVPELQRLLREPALPIVMAAADAIKALSPYIQKNPAMAADVSNDLLQAIQRSGAPGQPIVQPGTDAMQVRISLIAALGPLTPNNDPAQMLNVFSELLGQNEPPGVRQAALQGLAALKEKGAQIILRELDPTVEPDPNVRATAAAALADTGSFAFADQLEAASSNEHEVPKVRDAAWAAFQRLLPGGTPNELIDWANRFERARKWDRQVTVLKVEVQKQQDPASIAGGEQTIGGIYADRLHQPDLAIPYLTQALDYWQTHNAKSSTVAPLVGQLMNADLSARRWSEAVAFARNQIDNIDAARQEDVIPQLTSKARDLAGSNKPEDQAAARVLIEGALGINRLDPIYKQPLRDLLDQLPPVPTTSP